MKRFWALALLAACAQVPATPEVAQVILFRDTVNVVMTDGTLCVAKRPGASLAWQGVLRGCPHALPIEVRLIEPVPVRRELTRDAGAVVVIAGAAWG